MKTQISNRNDLTVYLIYTLLFALFIFKMFFYANEIKYFPDRSAHLSYVVYMEEHPLKIIPDYGKIKMIMFKADDRGDHANDTELKKKTSTCYLGHPPFYYKFLQMCNVIKIEQGRIYADFTRICHINICITAFAMMIILGIGFQQLAKANAHWIMHFMYVVICTCLPLYGYVGSNINNDNFCNLGMAVFLAGAVCYFEKGRCYKAYWLIAVGVLICFFSKLTSGVIVFVVCVGMILLECWKNKSLKIICNRYFVSTLPCFLLIGSYFVFLYAKYGTVQPSYAQFASLEEFRSSEFYLEEALRTKLSFGEDVIHFLSGLLDTWMATYSSNYMVARTGILAFPFVIVLILFLIQAVYGLYHVIKNQNLSITILPFLFVSACIIAILIQFASHRNAYLKNGYLGGYQARYYMPCLPVVAIGACGYVQRFYNVQGKRKDRMIFGCVILCGLLMIYADFFYYVRSYYQLPV